MLPRFFHRTVRPHAVFEFFVNLVVVVGAVFLLRTFLVSPFQVYGPSMCNTFNVRQGQCLQGGGEYLLLNKAVYQNFFGWRYRLPQRGDVVIFRPPMNGGEFFIKRVIGLPGERVELRNGDVLIDGERLDEPYLADHSRGKTYPIKGERIFSVPEETYFVLGDHRQASSDSRRCFSDFGCIGNASPYLPLAAIQGKAWVVLWPFSQARFVPAIDYSALLSK